MNEEEINYDIDKKCYRFVISKNNYALTNQKRTKS